MQMQTGFGQHIGQEQTIKVNGRDWRLSRWTRAIWREWLEWAKKQIPDPVEECAKILDKFPKDLQEKMVTWALEKKSRVLSLGSPEVNALFDDPEGTCHLLYLLLKKHQPDATEDDAMDVFNALGQEVLNKHFDLAAGVGKDNPGKDDSPAADTNTPLASPTGTKSTAA